MQFQFSKYYQSDLGKENSTDNSIALIYQIINRLYEYEKPVIVTTNFTSVALRKKLGEKGDAIISRLAEMCEFIKISGEDWRMKNAREWICNTKLLGVYG